MSCVLPQQRADLVIAAARKYLGARFHHQGRHPDAMDCIGLLVMAHRDAGYDIEDHTVYARHPDPELLFKYIDLNFERVERPAEPGDCLLFQYRKRGPQHVAILTEPGKLIHTWAGVGKVVESNEDERWLKRLHSVWHVKEERWQP